MEMPNDERDETTQRRTIIIIKLWELQNYFNINETMRKELQMFHSFVTTISIEWAIKRNN
ncbi:CLUMA_CG020692, isoform A [Clunio marinus]|uniref:CLUMA_CG020692, isoform A n=1 Tax=Clunio marinus TaxID=568069 RepID=A0A1J1J6X8_9DIPT|nr:CLUMA_CG020692, isoform A [Clunio marinus]